MRAVIIFIGIFLIMFIAWSRYFIGYSTCGRCNMPWSLVKEHTISYTKIGPSRSGMFALCEDCWKKLSRPEQRLPYYRAVWERWSKDPGYLQGKSWDILETNILAGF